MSHELWSKIFPHLVETLSAEHQCTEPRLLFDVFGRSLFESLIEPLPKSILFKIPDDLREQQCHQTSDILRLDRLGSQSSSMTSPNISGNKAFKLIGHIDAFERSNKSCLLSFGGRWSNHLHALAALCQRLKIPSIGFVRGYSEQPLTATLKDCVEMGMTLKFCDKLTYAQRYDLLWREELSEHYDAWVIPEGGEGHDGLVGFEALAPVLNDYNEIWIAAGTGTSALGVALQLNSTQTLIIVNVVSDQGELQRKWTDRVTNNLACQWKIIDDAHQRGFGKCSDELRGLIALADNANLPLEPVYTAKLLHAYLRHRSQGGSQVLTSGKSESVIDRHRQLLIHTGGLQGRRGYSL